MPITSKANDSIYQTVKMEVVDIRGGELFKNLSNITVEIIKSNKTKIKKLVEQDPKKYIPYAAPQGPIIRISFMKTNTKKNYEISLITDRIQRRANDTIIIYAHNECLGPKLNMQKYEAMVSISKFACVVNLKTKEQQEHLELDSHIQLAGSTSPATDQTIATDKTGATDKTNATDQVSPQDTHEDTKTLSQKPIINNASFTKMLYRRFLKQEDH